MNSRSSRILLVVLVLSLAANIALIGFVAGQHTARDLAPPPMGNPLFGMVRYVRSLPEARRDELDPLLKDYRRAARPAVREMRRAQHEFRAAIQTDPLDADRVRAALSQLQALMSTHQAQGHESLLKLLGEMSAEERQALNQALTPERFRRRHHERDRSAG